MVTGARTCVQGETLFVCKDEIIFKPRKKLGVIVGIKTMHEKGTLVLMGSEEIKAIVIDFISMGTNKGKVDRD